MFDNCLLPSAKYRVMVQGLGYVGGRCLQWKDHRESQYFKGGREGFGYRRQ